MQLNPPMRIYTHTVCVIQYVVVSVLLSPTTPLLCLSHSLRDHRATTISRTTPNTRPHMDKLNSSTIIYNCRTHCMCMHVFNC